MTEQEIIDYYVNLLILQYKGKPKAEAHIRLLTKMGLMDMLIFKVAEAYDLYTSTGYELDVIGKYQGVSRTGYTFTRQVTLDDESFRILIQMAIVKNNSNASLIDIDDLINKYFGADLKVFDFGKMRIGYYISTAIASSDLVEMLITQGLLPKPAAVSLTSTVRYPVLNKFFGYSSVKSGVNPNNSPYNTVDNYNLDWPWVSVKYTIGKPVGANSFITTELIGQRLNQENNGHMIA